jgi:alanyl-tRNA synthetase
LQKSSEIRDTYLKFFEERGHKIVPSSPVVPYDDPTLLFTNAGMNQFKDVFLGTGTRDYTRAVDSQKCIRAGGKHNDLEEVGRDGYHHTFFEMLGNWSFGDYYKKDAIKWAWELLTEVYKLPKQRLWASVYKDDDEAFELWKTETDINPDHILRFDEKDNFWEMGDTGPCGPCSEIHIDLTENGCSANDINADNEDVIEIWNLVFIQYNRDESGKLNPLPKKHIDTGMGFERVVRALQGTKSNYETDLFLPIINKIAELTGQKYERDNLYPFRAIADHIRCLTFAITDGAIPSNEGRGYVLRRILRRASRLARKLGSHEPVLYMLVDTVVENFSMAYPELKERQEFVKNVIKSEEESFNVTLDRGIELFNEVADKLEQSGTKIFSGEDAFKLYDTYGFPLDLTRVMADERGLSVDEDIFNTEMEKQKERARSARESTKYDTSNDRIEFSDVIYDPYNITTEGIVTEMTFPEDQHRDIVSIKHNPFFQESGGQITDTGKIVLPDNQEIHVLESRKSYLVTDKPVINLKDGENVKVLIDYERRQDIQRNHSATHLMHEALRRVLGSHIKQMGSLVHNEYLRFDFPHFKKLEETEIQEIEEMVNFYTKESMPVITEEMSIEQGNKIPNVKKFFGEKYGDIVRVVTIDPKFSIEFCGGTHVSSTDDIGLFKIVKEESISSGTRRIFARTGKGIIKLIDEKLHDIEHLMEDLPDSYRKGFRSGLINFEEDFKAVDYKDAELMRKLLQYQNETLIGLEEARQKYLEEKKQAEKALRMQNLSKAFKELDSIIEKAETYNGVKIVAVKMDLDSMDELKEVGETMRNKLQNGIGLIAIVTDGKINLVCSVSDNLIKEKGLNAGQLIGQIAKKLGGGGGGRPTIATAGAKDVNRLDKALTEFVESLKSKLN